MWGGLGWEGGKISHLRRWNFNNKTFVVFHTGELLGSRSSKLGIDLEMQVVCLHGPDDGCVLGLLNYSWSYKGEDVVEAQGYAPVGISGILDSYEPNLLGLSILEESNVSCILMLGYTRLEVESFLNLAGIMHEHPRADQRY
ncbi:hypothetical protein L1987_64470 [Smallanthus sonchifolius]|uniref:Uncharacterized protein n=1 Tax=Smallanthus sonchifolius TaxID=185202 RepID=A0ACB9CGD1_9ASTR|nr:hypothetical protein L1987_64470 [Smallanthus sonchifolius]